MGTAAGIPETQQTREREMEDLYWRDPYSWAMQQAEALRGRDFAAVDWKNVIEEIEDVGGRHADRLRSQYARAIEHLLKLQYRETKETEPVAGWTHSVNQARTEIEDILQRNPGLKRQRDALFHDAWGRASKDAVNAFVHQSTENITNASLLFREQKRLTREWRRTRPQENPSPRQQVEDSDWMPKRLRLSHRPQSRQQSDPRPDWSR